ncbi:MAG: hypothetical protein CFE29_13485 [Bradyrhizobiaceae bacterium PARB1]|jgi:hypothetical protein|nr:MAG: hypothetical protein CFE29_13485 [Bradyrhizobiaceae bacterium PARB1]
MLKKYLSKFTVDILPSVFATVVGAYIVNYYIIPKAREDRPPAPAAAVSAKPPEASQAQSADTKPAETAAEVVDAPVPAPAPAKKAADKPVEKAATEKSEKAAESRRHPPAREKAVAKAEPAKSEPPAAAPAPAPALATVGTAPSGDANDLARAAIERLSRGEKVEAPRAPERTASVQPQAAPAPLPQAQPMQQLPPPIVVSNPSAENSQFEQSRGPRPPSDVPVPMREMQANAEERSGRTNVVEDVLIGAKSMFDRVIPRPFER